VTVAEVTKREASTAVLPRAKRVKVDVNLGLQGLQKVLGPDA
jgi:hypothetical protein